MALNHGENSTFYYLTLTFVKDLKIRTGLKTIQKAHYQVIIIRSQTKKGHVR